ncbi:MAG: ComF family protein [Flavobacteriaceae bacterium]|nr:ComF family protein [Flavobacteriaceae bacterium]
MLNLLFPKVCSACKSVLLKTEEILCTQCRHNLPLVSHYKTGNETMKNIFYGKIPIEQATALIKFQKGGITQELLHNLKYRGQEEISYFFGKWLGKELTETEKYKNIKAVIPVPLHKQKLKKRGYNQVEGFGKEIAKALEIPYYDDVLIKISKTKSQVFKQRFTRFQSEEVFTIQREKLIENKHILLVDDIITTGATLENCALELLKANKVKLSFATIAIA